MLWYKSWLETRWRFLIGLGIVMCSAAATVFSYPEVMKVLPHVSAQGDGEIGRRIREAAQLVREYRGYVWSEWFRKNLAQWWTLFAVLLGTGGLLPQASGGAALFTLSMPVSRNRLVAVRAAAGLAELLILAVVPSLLVPMLSPAVKQTYGVGDALVHSACIFIAGSVFFSFALLLSTLFSDVWRPLLIALSVVAVLALGALLVLNLRPYSIFRVMTGEAYFYSGELPWPGLVASVVVSAALQYGAARNIARRDF
jgi:ABC-2 type transport system permease protein